MSDSGADLKQWVSSAKQILHRYYDLLVLWKQSLRPALPDDPWHPLFVEALQNSARVKYLLCTLAFGTEEEKRDIYQTCREEVKQIYERIQIFDASSSETDAEAE